MYQGHLQIYRTTLAHKALLLDVRIVQISQPSIVLTSGKLIMYVDCLFARARFATDVNECVLDTHHCQHQCQNTAGSYVCNCNLGYQLNVDARACDGTDRAAHAFRCFIAMEDTIYTIH